MSSMSKLFTITIAASLALSANGFNLEQFVRRNVVTNPQVKVKKIETVATQIVPGAPEWNTYMIVMDLNYRGKDMKAPETIFVNEKAGLATMDLISLKAGKSWRRLIRPHLPESYYDDAHLLFGNKNAAHKLVLFSDPDCPFCREDVPKTIQEVKQHPDKIALYYYHMPLTRLHPVSDVLTRIMEVLHKQGRIDDAFKMYQLKISYRETNATKILAEVKKQFGIEVTQQQIDDPAIKAAVKSDIDKGTRLMINGTPTYYYDGRYDNSRIQYKSALLGH